MIGCDIVALIVVFDMNTYINTDPPPSLVHVDSEDEAYLSRMQRDREEMLEMQRQMQLAGESGEGGTDDVFGDRYYSDLDGGDRDVSMAYQFRGEADRFIGEDGS